MLLKLLSVAMPEREMYAIAAGANGLSTWSVSPVSWGSQLAGRLNSGRASNFLPSARRVATSSGRLAPLMNNLVNVITRLSGESLMQIQCRPL